MEYRMLGRSGLSVSRLTLGAMTFGAGTGIWESIAGLDADAATRLVGIALDSGVNLIDTADVYSQGRSEDIVGQALARLGVDETRMLIASKVRLRTGPGRNQVGLGRSHIIRSVETSLRRLRRDHIDLLQLHDRDALTPLDETLRAIDDLVTQGKVRHIGVCNFTASELERAYSIASAAHWTRVCSNQVHYSLATRDIEQEVAPVAQLREMALMVWSPLAGGYLSGKYTPDGNASAIARGRRVKLDFPPIDRARVDPIVRELRDIGRELEATPAQVALAWLLGRREVAAVIVGARSEDQLSANLRAADVTLTSAQRERLDTMSQPAVTYPHWMQRFHDQDRV
jgi:aryl-alcohol dehydrogenase-like predicted oxidoreductase